MADNMTWTSEQKQVIDLRDRSLLVSAAAGSGKTAVLVQRIIERICDESHPVDIDRLLVVTFTNAAAGEMRERVQAAIAKRVEENPDNTHLRRQEVLAGHAHITTIDSFCLSVLREHFQEIELDPGFRIADEGELKLLQADVLEALLEEEYEQASESFIHFMEAYAPGKDDERAVQLILQLYGFAVANPRPEDWLNHCLESYGAESMETLEKQPWMCTMTEQLRTILSETAALYKRMIAVCKDEGGMESYESVLLSEQQMIEYASEASKYDKLRERVNLIRFGSKPRKKKTDSFSEDKAKRVWDMREQAKKQIKSLSEDYFADDDERLLQKQHLAGVQVKELVRLTQAFLLRYSAAKRKKNLVDFGDLEHLALNVLSEKTPDGEKPTLVAAQYRESFEEIMIDEYQDSNYVQELILTSISRTDPPNLFMVGDVKQSIYRFRLARPELFMEKYKSYSTEEAQEQRIDLHKNFRSREQVLESVNFIFRQIMGEDLGGITYDKDAALYPGASFPEGESEEFVKTEVLLVERDGEELSDVQDYEDSSVSGNRREMENQTGQELEALAIAQRIKEIVGKEQIVDKETKEYRPVKYGDIVILLRTAYGWAETFREVLASQGIPVYCTSRTGYFSATEIVTVLNYLKVCDNPLQDIPLMGVLRSPIVGCTSQELAELRIQYPDGLLYESVSAYAGENEKNSLNIKLKGFLSLLEKVRNMAAYTPVHELILYVLKETGYGDYARALPGGEQRFANLTMLVEKAMDYEKTSYRGLFNFVRYIEQLQAYEVDYGEVNLTGAGNTAVEIMTIHKSKGLEFPVVFVAGMGKQFNFQDMNAGLLLHPELGIGADAIIPEKRVIASSLNKQVIRRQLLKESLGEELRVLYVAMTRAKEKLILTGTVGKLEKQMLSLSRFLDEEEELLPLGTRMKAKNYWAFVLPALVRHRAMSELLWEYGILMKKQPGIYDDISEFVIKKITVRQMTEKAVLIQAGNQMQEEYLKNWDENKVYDAAVKEEIEKRFSFVYPYKYLEDIPVKVSVSDLKKRSWHDESELEENISVSAEEQEEEQEAPVPAFMAEKQEEYKGAARGTAYHRVMECLDYAEADTEEQLRAQLKRLLESQKMTEQEAECIRIRDIRRFVESGLGQRMKKAAMKKHLYREQPFVIQRSASMLDDGWKNETVLVQGIIDAYFMEEEEIVLVDYKTDRVKRGQEQKLIDLYHVQLEDYARALERMTGKKVKEKIIYSFTLQKEILL